MFEETIKVLEEQYPNWNFGWQIQGRQVVGFCPEHNDTHKPNLTITDKGNGEFFKCFACGFKGNTRTLQGYKQSSLQTRILSNTAEIFYDALDSNKCVNAQIANAYLAYRNPHLKKLVTDNLLVGVVPENFNIVNLKSDLATTDEEKKQFDEILNDLKQVMNAAQHKVPLCFFYTNPQGLVEQIKIRYIYAKEKYFDIKSINFEKEREDKQFSILKSNIQTINAFGLHLYTDMPKNWIFVTEGEFNTLSFLGRLYKDNGKKTFGAYKAVSIGSVQNLETNVKLFKKLQQNAGKIIFALDSDTAGQKAITEFFRKHAEFANEKILSLKDNKDCKDIDEYFTANDYCSAVKFYEYVKTTSVKEMLQTWNLHRNKEEEKDIENIIKQAKENPKFDWIIDILSENIDEDSRSDDPTAYPEQPIREWYIENLIPKQKISILAGLGGTGKTTIALQWLLHLLLNVQTDDIPIIPIEKFMVISAEEDRAEIWGKINSLLNSYFTVKTGKTYQELQALIKDKIRIITKHTILTTTEFGAVKTTEDYEIVKIYINDFDPDVVLVDSLTSTNPVQLQLQHIAQMTLSFLQKLIDNRTCIILNHLTKDAINAENIDASKMLGSASVLNKARHVEVLHKNQIKIIKSNLLPLNEIENYYYELKQGVADDGSGKYTLAKHIKKICKKKETAETKKQGGNHDTATY